MAVTESAVLQQVVRFENLVEFTRNITAAGAWDQQFFALVVHLAVDFPQPQVRIRGMA